jgi:uncharacterized protein YqjF (DUF2071 family)
MNRPFLTAEWRNLFLATYAVPPSLLKPHLPPGLELDTRNGDAFVSLVAFEFLRTRPLFPVAGDLVSCSSLGNFTELNLRFYVRHGGERGVVFVREFVPRSLVAWVARTVYNEPYLAAPLTSSRQEDDASLTMEYRLHWNGREHLLRVTGDKPAFLPGESSEEHFFKEHHWGYGRTRGGQSIRYRVTHPVWEVYPVRSHHLDLDWVSVYGPEWDVLGGAAPMSTILAVGSPIAVYPKGEFVQV